MAAPLRKVDDRSTRDRVLDVAEHLFAKHGFHGVSLAGIGDQLGIAKSSLLHHFPSKKLIHEAVLERIADDLAVLVAEARTVDGDDAVRFRMLIELYQNWCRTRPDYNRMILRELIDHSARSSPVRRWVLKPAVDDMLLLAELALRSERPSGSDPAAVLIHTLGGIAYAAASGPTFADITGRSEDDIADRCAEHVMRTIDAAPHQSPNRS